MKQDRYSIAVIGCGHWGKNLARNFNSLGCLSMICDSTEVGRTTASKLASDVAIVGSVDEVLSSSVNAVAIATPAETHYSLVKRALLAGKDVFVEKPMALKAQEGMHMVQLAKEHGRVLMVGHVLEYHPAVQKLTRLVQSGVLGKLQYIYSNRLSLGKIRREENILWSFAPHDIAIILRMLGMLPIQVSACGGSYIQANIADVTVTHMLFDSGVRAHIHVSWLHPFKEQRLVVIGDKKVATFDDVNRRLTLFDQRVDLREGEPIPIRGEGEVLEYDELEPLAIECRNFIEAGMSRKPPLTDGESGVDVLKVLEAAQRSLILNGAPVEVLTASSRSLAVAV